MYDLDHKLNGQLRNQHLQEIKRQIQHEQFAAGVKAAQDNLKTPGPIRPALVAFINLLTR